MKRITFLGDIMCEEPLLRASKHGRAHDFTSVFKDCKKLFSESDYLIGNLETVFAGKKAGYTKSLFSFNTPDSFAKQIAASGINMVTTATNHALDRDKAGLIRTLKILDHLGIEHIGANRSVSERNTLFTKCFEGKTFAFLNYTYGTNLNESPFPLKDNEYYLLNLLMPQKKVSSSLPKGLKGHLSKILYKIVPLKHILTVKKIIGRDCANHYQDILDKNSLVEEYLERIKTDVKYARERADIVIVSLHIGGQFNDFPGEQVKYFTSLFSKMGADYLIDTHAHVVQRYEYIGSTFVAHCLGNFSISPSSVYVPQDLKPEYSIALHLYIDDRNIRPAFTILKIVEDKKHHIRVVPVDTLAAELSGQKLISLQKDVTFIYNRFSGKQEESVPICNEYSIDSQQIWERSIK